MKSIIALLLFLPLTVFAQTPVQLSSYQFSFTPSVDMNVTLCVGVNQCSTALLVKAGAVTNCGYPFGTVAQWTHPGTNIGCWGVPVTPVCASLPSAPTRQASCPAGFTGSFTQTASITAAPYPQCFTSGAYSPTVPPAGACTPVPAAIPICYPPNAIDFTITTQPASWIDWLGSSNPSFVVSWFCPTTTGYAPQGFYGRRSELAPNWQSLVAQWISGGKSALDSAWSANISTSSDTDLLPLLQAQQASAVLP